MSANSHQVGGSHYSSTYQHWDLVQDIGLSYMMGCITKYVTRFNRKNGIEDLTKAIHFCEKQLEIINLNTASDPINQPSGVFHAVNLPNQLELYTEEYRTLKVGNFLEATFPNSMTCEKESLASLIFSILCIPYIKDIDNDTDFEEEIENALFLSIPKLTELIELLKKEANRGSEPTSAYVNQG